MNVVMTTAGNSSHSLAVLNGLIDLADSGLTEIFAAQKAVLAL